MSIGPTLGNYNIISRLSVGGMGEVYLAEDTQLHRKVALKVLPDWGEDPERLERFQWEARVLATLSHPNIVTIFSVEKYESVHFFTMELVEGQTLREIISPCGLPLARFLELAIPLADALAAAHQRGIVHRDIKPGNIMVRPDGRLKMLDFGLAKRERGTARASVEASEENLRCEPQTQDGRLFGTVAYMSPEQIAGKPLDHRADLFTLGIVFYEMLTGGRPFEDTDWAAKITVHLNESETLPAPPEAHLPERLEEIIHRCLERDIEERYQTAESLREDLRELQLEIVSGSFSSTQIARPDFKTSRKSGVAVLLGTLLVFLSLFGIVTVPRFLGYFSVDQQTPSEQKVIAVLPFQNVGHSEDAYFAAGITEEIISRLASVRALKVVRVSNLERDVNYKIGSDLGAGYLLEGTVLWSHDDQGNDRVRVIPKLIQLSDGTHLWSERYDRVIDDIFTVQSQIAEEVIRQLNIQLLEPEREILAASQTTNMKAYEAYLRGMDYSSRHEPDPKNWELAVDMLERAIRLDPEFAPAYAELSRVHSFVYHQNIDRTSERLKRARETADRAAEIAPLLPDGHRALGYYFYWGLGDYKRALEEFYIVAQRAPNDSKLYEGIAYIRRRQGRFDEALSNFNKAVELNPKDNWLATEIAHTYTNLRRYEEADHYYDTAINLAPDLPHPYQLKALNLLQWTGDIEGAREILSEMPGQKDTSSLYNRFKVEYIARNYSEAQVLIRAIESDFVGLNSALFPTEISLGAVHQMLGELEQARIYYEQARDLLINKIEERPEDPRLRSALGLTYSGLTATGVDYKAEAITEGKKAAALYPLQKDAFVGPEFLEHLAVIYAWVGDRTSAIELIEQILEMPSRLSIPSLKVYPCWDPLRGHPRFDALLKSDH